MSPMTTKGTTTEVPATAARRTAITAARGALQTTHSAANLVNSVDKEAARMLRTAEGLARSATARLEFLGREEALKKKEQEKQKKKDTDDSMAGATAAASARPRRRGRRSRKAASPPVASEPLPPAAVGPLLAGVSGATASCRVLKQQRSRERSPRRGASLTTTSSAAVSHPGPEGGGEGAGPGLGGFLVGQTVSFLALSSRPDLNNMLGTVMSVDVDAGRVAVKVDDSNESIKVKPCNLKLTIFGAGGRQVL